jgi:ribosomal protein S18 acetylase RimI-like enzyme
MKLSPVFAQYSRVFVVVALLFGSPTHAGDHRFLSLCRSLLASGYWQAASTDTLDSRVEWVRDAKQLDAVVDVLNTAFEDDPLMAWFHSNKDKRSALLRTFVNHAFINGSILQVRGGKVGAALWFETNRAQVGPLSLFLTGQALLIPSFGLRTGDLLKFDAKAAAMRAHLAKVAAPNGRPALYLWYVGVVPERRGEGWATSLMQPILDRADREGRAVVLELQKTGNIPLYEHFGFGNTAEWIVPSSAPKTYTMVRPPKPGEANTIPTEPKTP